MARQHSIILVEFGDELTPDYADMEKMSEPVEIPVMRDCVLYARVSRTPPEVLDVELRDTSPLSDVFTVHKLAPMQPILRIALGTLHSPLHVWWHFHNKLPPPPQGVQRSLFKTRMSIEVVGIVDLPAPRKKRI